MILKGLLIIAVIALIYPISGAYNFKEDIHTNGVGLMSVRTDLPYAYDKAQGNGIQSYTREFNTNGIISQFSSSYNLSKCQALAKASRVVDYADFEKNSLRSNQYLLSTSPSGGFQHFISLIGNPLDMDPSTGEMYINASGQIIRSDVYINSIYKINANADFREKVIEKDSGYAVNMHPVVLAESWAFGKFSANSSFYADVPFTDPIGLLKIWAGIGTNGTEGFSNQPPNTIVYGNALGNLTPVTPNCNTPNCNTTECWEKWYKDCLNSPISNNQTSSTERSNTPAPGTQNCNSPECWQNWYRDHMN